MVSVFSVSFAMFFAVIKSKFFKKNYIFKAFSGIWAVMISLSTVFIKQHSVLDVFAGIGTAVLVFIIVIVAEAVYDRRRKNGCNCYNISSIIISIVINGGYS